MESCGLEGCIVDERSLDPNTHSIYPSTHRYCDAMTRGFENFIGSRSREWRPLVLYTKLRICIRYESRSFVCCSEAKSYQAVAWHGYNINAVCTRSQMLRSMLSFPSFNHLFEHAVYYRLLPPYETISMTIELVEVERSLSNLLEEPFSSNLI